MDAGLQGERVFLGVQMRNERMQKVLLIYRSKLEETHRACRAYKAHISYGQMHQNPDKVHTNQNPRHIYLQKVQGAAQC